MAKTKYTKSWKAELKRQLGGLDDEAERQVKGLPGQVGRALAKTGDEFFGQLFNSKKQNKRR